MLINNIVDKDYHLCYFSDKKGSMYMIIRKMFIDKYLSNIDFNTNDRLIQ